MFTRDHDIFRRIFRENWSGFKVYRAAYDTEYYEEVVQKMLPCAGRGL